MTLQGRHLDIQEPANLEALAKLKKLTLLYI